MAISRRQAGAIVQCPKCGEQTEVPHEDLFAAVPAPFAETFPPDQQSEPVPPPQAPSQSVRRPPSLPTNLASSFVGASLTENVSALERPDPPNASREADPDEPGDEDSVANADGELSKSDEPFVPAEIGDEAGEFPLAIRRRSNLEEEMDLTPMVDVTFQLLIFFMVSASFSLQKSIEVPTPDPDQKGASQQVQTLDDLQGTSIIVKIDASNTIWIDDEPLADALRLSDTLRDKMRREQKTELLVTADAASLHRTVISVIDAANEVGMQKIRMTSKKKVD